MARPEQGSSEVRLFGPCRVFRQPLHAGPGVRGHELFGQAAAGTILAAYAFGG